MGRNMKEIKIIGLTGKGKFPSYIAVGIIYSLGVWMSDIFPYRSEQYLLFSAPVGMLSFLSAIWLIRKPNSNVKYFLQISASALIALIAYRGMSYLFPEFSPFTEVLIIFSFLFVHTLPIWNLPAATLIGDELYAPKTWIGKFIFRALLFIAPIGAISGTLLGRTPKSALTIFILGMICLYLAFSIPFASLSRYSTKDNRPLIDDGLKSEVSNPTTRKSSHQRSTTSRKRIPRNKKE